MDEMVLRLGGGLAGGAIAFLVAGRPKGLGLAALAMGTMGGLSVGALLAHFLLYRLFGTEGSETGEWAAPESVVFLACTIVGGLVLGRAFVWLVSLARGHRRPPIR